MNNTPNNIDRTLGPVSRPLQLRQPRRVKRGATTVRVSEDARKCTVFLGYEEVTQTRPAPFSPVGTGFLVHTGDGGRHGIYLVTAAHVAKKISTDPFDIRHNERNGGGRTDHIDAPVWHYHSMASVDIAIMHYDPPYWADCTMFPVWDFVDDERLKYYDVGPGDAAYIAGLFHFHSGKSRNLVVVHNGNIALMPTDEKIPTEDGDEVEGYLVESQALQGASGSPVYLRPTLEFQADARFKKDAGASLAYAEGRDYLLGVWIAAWPAKLGNAIAAAHGRPTNIWAPVGMGIVIPAKRVCELLLHPDRMQERRDLVSAETRAKGAHKT